MMQRKAVSRQSPLVLTFTDVRSYVFTAIFVGLSVLLPWILHQFRLAGPTYLPMHIFILVAGLLFGWRAGLAVGLLTPLISYAISGMPKLIILPQTIVELATYGLIAGLLRERYTRPVFWSLLGAMVAGRLALLVAVSTIFLITGQNLSPLGIESSPLFVLWSTIRQGWPGIIIQLVTVPAIVSLTEKFVIRK